MLDFQLSTRCLFIYFFSVAGWINLEKPDNFSNEKGRTVVNFSKGIWWQHSPLWGHSKWYKVYGMFALPARTVYRWMQQIQEGQPFVLQPFDCWGFKCPSNLFILSKPVEVHCMNKLTWTAAKGLTISYLEKSTNSWLSQLHLTFYLYQTSKSNIFYPSKSFWFSHCFLYSMKESSTAAMVLGHGGIIQNWMQKKVPKCDWFWFLQIGLSILFKKKN